MGRLRKLSGRQVCRILGENGFFEVRRRGSSRFQLGTGDGVVDGLAFRTQPAQLADVIVRHDNGTQFTSRNYREVADALGTKLSRTRYRHPDGECLGGKALPVLE